MRTRSLFLMTVASLALASCSQNEVMMQNPDAQRAIGFGVYTGTQTRGVITDNSLTDGGTANGLKVDGKGFGILAYQTEGAYETSKDPKGVFMDNVNATWNASPGGWEYSPVKFWPEVSTGDKTNDNKISFFAYAPYTAASDATANGIALTNATGSADAQLTFTIRDNQKDMVDLVVSDPMLSQTSTSNSGKVQFAFKHVLTRVTMAAYPEVDITTNTETKLYIKSVKLNHSDKLGKVAEFDMNAKTWATPTAYLDADYSIAASDANGVLNLSVPNWKGYTTASVDISAGVGATPVSLFTANQYLFFIPIDGATGTADNDVTATITYDLATLPSSDPGATATVSSFTKTVNLGTGVFAQGKAYKFTFKIGMNAISVDVTDFSWDADSDKPLEVN